MWQKNVIPKVLPSFIPVKLWNSPPRSLGRKALGEFPFYGPTNFKDNFHAQNSHQAPCKDPTMPTGDFQDPGLVEKLNFLCPFRTDFLVLAKRNGKLLSEPWSLDHLFRKQSCIGRKTGGGGGYKVISRFLPQCWKRLRRWLGITILGKQQPRSCSWPGMLPPTTIHMNIFYGGVGTMVEKNKESGKKNAHKVPWKSPFPSQPCERAFMDLVCQQRLSLGFSLCLSAPGTSVPCSSRGLFALLKSW